MCCTVQRTETTVLKKEARTQHGGESVLAQCDSDVSIWELYL